MIDLRDNESGHCWQCGYLLRGIDSSNCPECGRAFDRTDRASMNFGRPMGRLGRWALGRLGWGITGLAALACGLVWATVRWPVEGWRLSLIDVGFYWRVWEWRGRLPSASAVDATYIAGLMVGSLAMVLWLLRIGARGWAVARYRPPGFQRGAVWRRSLLFVLLGMATLLGMGIGWPYRLGQRWAREWELAPPTAAIGPATLLPAFVGNLAPFDSASVDAMIRAAVHHGDSHQKTAALKLHAERLPTKAIPVLKWAAQRERDPTIKALEIRLLGICGDVTSSAWMQELLADGSAEVREAAADALGMLHHRDFQLGNDWAGYPRQIKSDPVISLDTLLRATATEPTAQAPLPAGARQGLEKVMLAGPALSEREAAARALVNFPPAKYRLRLAEWGVWVARDDRHVELTKEQLDSIPPFVHQAGNAAAEFANRVATMWIWNKPIIHLTANVPMVVDLQAQIRQGRVWYAYPRPDDFVLQVGTFSAEYLPAMKPTTAPAPGIGVLDNAALRPLEGLRAGYPWMLPAHRSYSHVNNGPFSRGGALLTPPAPPAIAGLGVQWQSLIVTPTKPPWARPPLVPPDPRYAWWTRLRDVDCSWVSSRGEEERFIYYDGPTIAKTPVLPQLRGRRIEWDVKPNFSTEESWNANAWRDGLYIEVPPEGGPPRGGGLVQLLNPGGFASIDDLVKQRPGRGVENLFLEVLKDRGMTPSESAGLMDCWRKDFFEKPGKRMLVILAPDDYNLCCQITIRPKPTETVRVGIVLTELDPKPDVPRGK